MTGGAGSHGQTVDFNSDLTPQQQIFVAEYITDFNGHRSAIAAKYSPKSAHAIASQLLENPKIQNAINQALDDFGVRHSVLKKRILNQLSYIGFSDIRNYLTFNNKEITIKQSEDLTREQAAAVLEVKERTTKYGKTVTLKLERKHPALELMARHLGMFAQELPNHSPTASATKHIFSFEEFCVNAGYPKPFPTQVEMYEFVFSPGVGLLLGARNYGKTDYTTILGTGYKIYLEWVRGKPDFTAIIGTKVATRGQAMIAEICRACELAGVVFEVKNSKVLRVKGLEGKDHSVEALSIRTSLRGRHPKKAILDDIVTPEDTSEAVRTQAKKFYSEICKLTPDVTLIGQPVHKYDLYEELRPILERKLEVPHGTIPELDADLEAMKAAGVDWESISASYHLKIVNVGATPFDQIKSVAKFPAFESSYAFIDPASKGKDHTAITIVHAYGQGFAVVGFQWRKSWEHALDDIAPIVKKYKVKKIGFETNALGDQPLGILRTLFKPMGVGVMGVYNNQNKHSRIMAAGTFASVLHLAEDSHQSYKDHVRKYEYGSQYDDAPDSLASCLQMIGLIRGKD